VQERLQQNEPSIDYDNQTSLKVADNYIPSTRLNTSLAAISPNTSSLVGDIESKQLITKEDANKLAEAKDFLVSTYTDVPIYNSRIAKVTSILSDAKFPTADAKFWQCKMQAEVHINELIRTTFKLDRVTIDLEEIEYQIAVIDSMLANKETADINRMKLGFDRRRLANKLEQYKFETKILEKDIKQRLREVSEWADIAKAYEDQCESSTTNHEEHTYKNHLLALTHQYHSTKSEQERATFRDQANTFLRLVNQPLLP
jgi:hypothetical protein